MAAEAQRAGATLALRAASSRARSKQRDGVLLPSLGFKARFLIGADGARSAVAEIFGLGRNRRISRRARKSNASRCESRPALPALLRRQQLAPGYIGWVVPGHGVTQIGIAARRRRKPDLEAIDRSG